MHNLSEPIVHPLCLPIDLLESNLVGFWPLDENSGRIATDFGFGDNHGVLSSGITRVATSKGFACGFNGSNQITITNPDSWLDDLSNGFTILADIYPTNIAFQILINNFVNASYGFELRITSGLNLALFVHSSSGTKNKASAGTLSNNSWCHCVGVFDKSNIYVFLNGVKSTTTACSDIVVPTTQNLCIGSTNVPNARFIGNIRNVMLYNKALSDDEIRRHYDKFLIG